MKNRKAIRNPRLSAAVWKTKGPERSKAKKRKSNWRNDIYTFYKDRKKMSTVDPTLEALESELQEPAAGESQSFEAMLAEFADLENERRQHEERLDVIKNRVAALQEPLQGYFADNGIQNTRVKGLTIYVKTDRYVSKRGDVPTERICELLRQYGLGYIVSEGYNAASLKSKIVKEYIEAGVEVPPALAEVLNIGEAVKLATRK